MMPRKMRMRIVLNFQRRKFPLTPITYNLKLSSQMKIIYLYFFATYNNILQNFIEHPNTYKKIYILTFDIYLII